MTVGLKSMGQEGGAGGRPRINQSISRYMPKMGDGGCVGIMKTLERPAPLYYCYYYILFEVVDSRTAASRGVDGLLIF